MLEPEEIRGVIEAAREHAGLVDGAEITLEANPESVDAARLDGFRRAGVNRLSFGVQSFHDDDLRRLGRVHTVARAVESVRIARARGFDNISIDLMMWLPEQSLERWLESVDGAIAVESEHVSLYMLEVYPHLPLREQMTAGGCSQASDDAAAVRPGDGTVREDAGRAYETRMSPSQGDGRGTISSTGPTENGWVSAARPIRRRAACGGGTSAAPRTTFSGSLLVEALSLIATSCQETSGSETRCSPACV